MFSIAADYPAVDKVAMSRDGYRNRMDASAIAEHNVLDKRPLANESAPSAWMEDNNRGEKFQGEQKAVEERGKNTALQHNNDY